MSNSNEKTPSPGGEKIEVGDTVEVVGGDVIGTLDYFKAKGTVMKRCDEYGTGRDCCSVESNGWFAWFPTTSLRLVSKSSPSPPAELVVGQKVQS